MSVRLHVVSLPHTQTTVEHLTCAYTQKVRKFGKMMLALGVEVVIYSGEFNDAICTEHVQLISEKERRQWFGAHDLGAIHPITWDPKDEHWQTMNKRAIQEISKRRTDKHDLLLLSGGNCQQAITEGLPDMTACEPFVGYEGITTDFRAFESRAWMHHVYGLRRIVNGVWFDDVIPNYFDLDEFPEPTESPSDYLLFIGRVVQRKGPHIASQIAEKMGLKLLVAGPGVEKVEGDTIYGDQITFKGEYVGAVGVKERAKLMAGAVATLCPTLYLEPFGGVAVESMLAGTPVVASDWGAFPETVIDDVSGYRFRNLSEAVEAVDKCKYLDRHKVRQHAIDNYSLEAVAPRFTSWFNRLDTLWGEGWYA